jgi:hypothetical protein
MALKYPSTYRKSIGAFLGAAATWAGTAYVPDGSIDRNEWYALVLVALTTLGVYGVANDAPAGGPVNPAESVRDVKPGGPPPPPAGYVGDLTDPANQ